MRRLIAALLLSSCLAAGAGAATLAGVTLQDTYPVEGQTLKMNGIGLRTLFFVKVYVAALYTASPSHDAQQILKSTTPKVIRMQFLHSGSKADVEKEYRAGEQNNCGTGGCSKADAADFEHLVAVAPAVNVGDTSTFVFTAKGVTVYANDKPIDVINNPDLAYHLLEGFIGAHPPSEDLKAHLLGEAND
jgi:long-chain acyl-CoA synthetase